MVRLYSDVVADQVLTVRKVSDRRARKRKGRRQQQRAARRANR